MRGDTQRGVRYEQEKNKEQIEDGQTESTDGPGVYQPVDRGIFMLYFISDHQFFAVFVYELFRT